MPCISIACLLIEEKHCTDHGGKDCSLNHAQFPLLENTMETFIQMLIKLTHGRFYLEKSILMFKGILKRCYDRTYVTPVMEKSTCFT